MRDETTEAKKKNTMSRKAANTVEKILTTYVYEV